MARPAALCAWRADLALALAAMLYFLLGMDLMLVVVWT